MSEFTHQKRPLKADCLQWRGDNHGELASFCERYKIRVELESAFPVLWFTALDGTNRGCGLPVGYWAVRQSNGDIRTYGPSLFEALYETL